jgi:VWFA-related protein
VTDKRGNPVHGLKAADFRVFNDGKPGKIDSFEEHRKNDAVPSSLPRALPSGVYSNDYLEHPPHVLNVLFIDLTNIEIADQMYLNYQLGKFFDTLKPDEPVAIYARPGDATILLQSFTSDPTLLRAAVRKLLPRFPPLGREYMDDSETLHQIAAYLNQIPGRKNVLWLSGGPMLFTHPGITLAHDGEWRAIYDELETQRIAIYPIDVRGLMLVRYSLSARNLPVMNQTSTPAQHGLMNEIAEATGGRAVYNNNGIAQAVTNIVDDDGEYYTVTYSPHNLTYDNRWHKVRVTMPGSGYLLSYRRGYFADGDSPIEQPSRTRTRLGAGGTTELTSISRAPIVFEAQIHPGAPTNSASAHAHSAPRKGTLPYTVESSLPLDAFNIKSIDGKWKVDCGAEIMAFNSDGALISHQAKIITFTLRDEAARHPAGQELPLEEEIDLAKGDVYVYVAVFDRGSERLGALEIPYHVDAPKRSQNTPASK